MNAVRGIVPAAIAIPLILRVWSPTWFVVGWLVMYLVASALFASLALRDATSRVEQGWSTSIALLFCAVPISAVGWSNEPEHFWAATTVGVIFIAFEMSALPFLRIEEWRVGVTLVGLTITVCGLFAINPIVALCLAPVLFAMIHASDRIRKLKLELEERLAEARHTVGHDPLTGVLNRRGLAVALSELDENEITVALVDVDRFKLINDTHGHQVGDQVLIALAKELQRRFGPDFQLARLGGDEFVAVAPGSVSLSESAAAPIEMTTEVHQQELRVECGLSIGVSQGRNIDGAERLLSQAGFAMREAKRSGGAVAYFGSELSDRLDRTVQVAAIAGGGADVGYFVPVAQTIVANDKIVGCELLVRWRRPDGALLLPAQFLPMAAEAGLMASINDQMLDHAVRFASRFNNRPDAPFVSVNISAPHLGESGFCARVERLLAEHRVPAERLMIEITETEQLGGYEGWEQSAARLRTVGVNLAMDDFGTGYSSMERLQHLPITHLKFDRSLVQTVSGPFGQIVRGVAGFAKAVNIGVIAEGIETLDELESMRALDVTMVQGYLFHRPEPLDAVEVRIIEDRVSNNQVQADT